MIGVSDFRNLWIPVAQSHMMKPSESFKESPLNILNQSKQCMLAMNCLRPLTHHAGG